MYGRGDNDRDLRFPQAVQVAHFMFVVTLAIAFGVAGKDHTQWLEKKIPKVLAMESSGGGMRAAIKVSTFSQVSDQHAELCRVDSPMSTCKGSRQDDDHYQSTEQLHCRGAERRNLLICSAQRPAVPVFLGKDGSFCHFLAFLAAPNV